MLQYMVNHKFYLSFIFQKRGQHWLRFYFILLCEDFDETVDMIGPL